MAKRAGPVAARTDGWFETRLTFHIENFSAEAVAELRLDDSLTDTFAGTPYVVEAIHSPTLSVRDDYDGDTVRHLLAGTDSLAGGATGEVFVDVRFNPPDDSGIFFNTATLTAAGGIEDASVNGANPDPNRDGLPKEQSPTPIPYERPPPEIDTVIGIAKAATPTQATLADDGWFETSLIFTLEHFAGPAAVDLNVTDSLQETFGDVPFRVTAISSETLSVNTGYDGTGNLLDGVDSLGPEDPPARIQLQIRFNPPDDEGRFDNRSMVIGGNFDPDDSVDGDNPDPSGDGIPDERSPTPILYKRDPVPVVVGIAEEALPTQAILADDGWFETTLRFTLEHFAGPAAININVTDSLLETFGDVPFLITNLRSATLTVNTGYDGAGNLLAGVDSLGPGDAPVHIELDVRFNPPDDEGRFDNRSMVIGGNFDPDDSVDGDNPDPNGDDIPNELSPTPIRYLRSTKAAVIGIAEAGTTPRPDADQIWFATTLTFTVEHFSGPAASGVNIENSLSDTFGDIPFEITRIESDTLQVNRDYDGSEDAHLLTGSDTLGPDDDPATIELDVRFNPVGMSGVFNDRSSVTASNASTDRSQNGTNPDPNGDDNPIEESPTPLPWIRREIPPPGSCEVGVNPSRRVVSVGDTLIYTISVTNLGQAEVNGATVTDTPPPAFQPILERAQLVHAGEDGLFGTPDDYKEPEFTATGGILVAFSPFDLPGEGRARITYPVRVTAAALPGPQENTSSLTCLIRGTNVTFTDTSTVDVVADPLFDKATLIGKVFDDRNGNGIQDFDDKNGNGTRDEGELEEKGVPAVRIITPEGLVVTTDSHGRFHIADIEVKPRYGINYVTKLDANSLPERSLVRSSPAQITHLAPGGIGRVKYAVRLHDPDGHLEPRNCCGPFIETTVLTPMQADKKLDVMLQSVELVARDEYRLEFELASTYWPVAQCLELGVFTDGATQRSLLTNALVFMETHRQRIDIELSKPPSRLLSYTLFAYPAFERKCKSRLFQAGDAMGELKERNRFDMSGLDATTPQIIELPLELLNGPCPDASGCKPRYTPPQAYPHTALAVDNVVLPPSFRQVFRRDVNADTPLFNREVGELLTGELPYIADYSKWEVHPQTSHLREYQDQYEVAFEAITEPGLTPQNPDDEGRTLQPGQYLEAAAWDESPPQEGAPDGWTHLIRHPAFLNDHMDFNAEAKSAWLQCCNIVTSLETIHDVRNATYSLRFTNHHREPLRVCLEAESAMLDASAFKLLMSRCNQAHPPGLLSRVVEPEQTVEIFLGAFDDTGRPVNGQDADISVYALTYVPVIGPCTTPFCARTVELDPEQAMGYQIMRERDEENGHWRPPRTIELCGEVTATPEVTPEGKVTSLRLRDAYPVDPELSKPIETKYYDFGVGVVDITAGGYHASGNFTDLAARNGEDEDFVDGRIAAYWKGGKPLRNDQLLEWTLQFDTTKDDLDNLSENLERKDTRRLFRQLDPDRYYPTYGDDSTTVLDTDSQGAVYGRFSVEGMGLSGVWGNYHTDFTGTEFGHFNRSLYGAKLAYEDPVSRKYGDRRVAVKAFVSEAQTAFAHAELRATGGSLYYLRHTDIVMGSEKIWVEVRRRNTLQLAERQALVAGRDYEIDPLQGRILLRSPLNQIMRDRFNSVIQTPMLDGNDVFLLVDYEFVPVSLDDAEFVYGTRARYWPTDSLGLGLTYVVDEQGRGEQSLQGADAIWRLGNRSYVSAEYAHSANDEQQGLNASFNGGLTFNPLNTPAFSATSGDAFGIEAFFDLNDVKVFDPDETGRTRDEGNHQVRDFRVWWKKREAGFASSRFPTAAEITDRGVDGIFEISEHWTVNGNFTEVDDGAQGYNRTARLQSDLRLECDTRAGCWQLGIEARHEDDAFRSDDPFAFLEDIGDGNIVGARVGYGWDESTIVYGRLQHGGGNDAVAVGTNTRLNKNVAVSLESTSGERGDALSAGVELAQDGKSRFNVATGVGPGANTQFSGRYDLVEGHELFGSYTIDPDRSDGDRNLLSFGQARALGNRTRIYTESTFGEDDRQASNAHAFGIDSQVNDEWVVSTLVQHGEVEQGEVDYDRRALSVGATYTKRNVRATARAEFREDQSNAGDTRQYVLSNAVHWQMSPDHRMVGKFNGALIDDDLNDQTMGRFVELDLAHAYRPTRNDRFNAIARYTYLFDVGTEGQSDAEGDERSHFVAAEGVYELPRLRDFSGWKKKNMQPGSAMFKGGELELAAKLAMRHGKQRAGKGVGNWSDVALGMAALRASYKFSFTHRSCFNPDNVSSPRRTLQDNASDTETDTDTDTEAETAATSSRRCASRLPEILANQWEILAEYRWLKDFEGETRQQGALLGFYKEFDSRHHEGPLANRITNTVRLGLGYNFSGFDDNLRNGTYKAHGWFVDMMVAF